jgi:hypothetical protein
MEIFFKHIQNDDLDEAIKFFQRELLRKKKYNNTLYRDISNALIILGNNLTNLTKSNLLGTIGREQSNLEKNRIINQLLTLANKFTKIRVEKKGTTPKYSPNLIAKSLEILESKFNPNGQFICGLKENLLKDLTIFISNNLYEIFISTIDKGLPDGAVFDFFYLKNPPYKEVRDNYFTWLNRSETRLHITEIMDSWYNLNSKYIETEIKYIYKLNDISPDEFWSGYHVAYPDIRINIDSWSEIFSDSILESYKYFLTAKIFSLPNQITGYVNLIKASKKREVRKFAKSYGIIEMLGDSMVKNAFHATVRREIDKNIYIQKYLNSFSNDWLVNNVIIQFDYLKQLKI